LTWKNFQVLIVQDDPNNLPFLPLKDSTDLRSTAIYVRRLASSVEADYEELQNIINRRIETGHSNQNVLGLSRHLEDLKTLYAHLEKYRMTGLMGGEHLQGIRHAMGFRINPGYPKESFDDFVESLIRDKKKTIRLVLGIN